MSIKLVVIGLSGTPVRWVELSGHTLSQTQDELDRLRADHPGLRIEMVTGQRARR